MHSDNNKTFPVQEGIEYFGILQVQVVCELGARPVENAAVQILNKENPDIIILELTTDMSGKTMEIQLPAPPIIYSMEPSDKQPYSEYKLVIRALGLKTVIIDSTQILPFVKTTQPVQMPRRDKESDTDVMIHIGPHFLYGNYPPKIYEDELKEVVLAEPITIPEYIIVHDGQPADPAALNYKTDYRDYIKNVVSSQIYGNWTQETIYANILARLSFSLNRVYTGWYQNQGYNFNITSSTEYDQIWICGRNIDSNISLAVDYIFNYFLSLPEITQPILTQSCIGITADYPGMFSLWGSKFLGDQSYKALDILKYYYNEQIFINSTDYIKGTSPWSGGKSEKRDASDAVKDFQSKLKILAHAYNEIPLITVDGVLGENTINAILAFQRIFDLPLTGTIDTVTWYKLNQIYQRLVRISNLCNEYK